MLKKQKREHIKNLLDELSYFKINGNSDEKQSLYFIDYLYGVSDINEEFEKLNSEDILLKDWILFYRILLHRDTLVSKKYNEIKSKENLFFLMRNEDDLKEFKSYLDDINKISNKKSEDIFNRYDKKITDEDIKNKFKSLLKNYIISEGKNEESFNYYKATCELGEFIKENRITLNFTQGEFFKAELGFCDNNKYSKIRKKYEAEKEKDEL